MANIGLDNRGLESRSSLAENAYLHGPRKNTRDSCGITNLSFVETFPKKEYVVGGGSNLFYGVFMVLKNFKILPDSVVTFETFDFRKTQLDRIIKM